MKVVKLKTEYQVNPVGTDCKLPRFSWQINSEQHSTLQVAYRIVVKTEIQIVWDSGQIWSDTTIHIPYAGDALKPSTLYEVSVSVWDNHDQKSEASGTFETGLLTYENFKAHWITHTLEEKEACPVFIKRFYIEKPVVKARIYASALGLYEMELNGKRVGEDLFTPGWTSYPNRIQYQTYDVTSQLQAVNTLEMTVANGWYKGIFGFTGQSNHYGDQIAAIVQLQVTYVDGSEEIFCTDESWQCKTGKIRYSEIYNGETIDSNFEDTAVQKVEIFENRSQLLVGQEVEPVRITTIFKPIDLIKTPKGEVVMDFGQNISGFVQLRVNAPKGTKIQVKHAEVLDKHGNFYTENLRAAKSTDTYVSNGIETVYQPHFTFHGFRYIQVIGLGESLNKDDFTACAIHTNMAQTGSFECSNAMINRLQKNIEWGQRGNFLDIPTDCPQRDERLGWTGDAQVFSRTSAYNMNVARFFSKWLRDLKVEQTTEYGVPSIVPNILGNQAGAAAWGDAATIIPWTIYLVYGDQRILEDQYESMKGWVEYIRARSEKGVLWQSGFQYADWLALDKEEMSDRVGATDRYLVATAYYFYSCEILYNTAQILHKEEDYVNYKQLHQEIKAAFNEEYITKTGRIVSETQTGCVLALHFNLANEDYRNRIIHTLEKNLSAHNNHLVTGFVGTPYINHVLSENGLHEIAGKVFMQEDYPSWLYAVKKGATTIWERWNSILPDGSFDESGMNSFNHYAYGAIGDWMYQKIGGLQLLEPGYKKIRIAPEFVKGITFATAKFESVHGEIVSSWRCENKKISVQVTIPANTTAQIVLPEKDAIMEVGSGTYQYEYDTETNLVIDKYSMASTLGQLFDQPLALELLEKYSPGMTTNPMIKFALGQTIAELTAMMPEGGAQLFVMIIDALNKAECQS